jgi:Carboxypeptidase regulatory-like domain/TonB dependent receptor/TonB-dependent Receptor Plug Domain
MRLITSRRVSLHLATVGLVLLVGLQTRFTWAQTSTGTILGTVTDSAGAAVPDAHVLIRSLATGHEQSVNTDSSGGYTVPNLQIGNYSITVDRPGFKTTVLPNIELQVAQEARIDAILQVGQVSESVTVSSSSTPLLNSLTSSVSQVVDTKTIQSTPLNGRNFWQLTQLTPGVSYIQGGQLIPTGGTSIRASAVNVNVNGLNPAWTGWYMDGANITEFQLGGTLIQPNVDALQEFRVETGNMGAQYGHFPTVINATLKSGSNQFHGVFYEFLRNNALDAKNYFFISPKGRNERDEPLHRNQFGVALGGPIIKDKTFFFIDLQSTLLSEAEDFNNVVPSLAERGGDFSASSIKIKNPLTGQPFPGNVIPASSISPQATFLLPYMPLPNAVSGTTSQAINTNGLKQQLDQADIKIDQQLRTADQLVGRYSIADNRETDPNPYPAMGSFPLRSRAQNAQIRWTHVFNAKWLNEAQVSYYRSLIDFNTSLAGQNINDQAGIQGFDELNTPANEYNFPSISIANYSNYTGGSAGNVPKHNKLRSVQYRDNVTYVSGKNQIRFGYENFHNTFMYQLGQNSTGVFTFNGAYSGDNFADFLLGYPLSVQRSYFRFLYGDAGNLQSTYVQDDYRVLPNLTINAGLRWEINTFLTGVKGQITGYDFNTQKLVVPSNIDLNATTVNALYPLFSDRIEFSNQLGLPKNIRPTAYLNLGPRIGLAWSPKPDWVVRSAYGIIYNFPDDNALNNTETSVPFIATQTVNNSTPTPDLAIGDFFQGTPIVAPNPHPGQPCPFGGVFLSCSTPTVDSMNTKVKNQYVQEWNLAVQHQFGNAVSLDVAYVGNKVTHIVESYSINDPPPGPGSVQARRPIPQWSTMGINNFSLGANYNALQAKLETRAWHGSTLLTSYTYGKCLSDGAFSTQTREEPNYGISYYGVCSYNLTHNLVISYVYQLPIGKGQAFLGNVPTWANAFIGNWQISGVTTVQSGLPFTATISTDTANTGVASQRPNISGRPTMLKKPSCWFFISKNSACTALDPTAPNTFTVPTQYSYGNGGVYTLRADNLVQFDVAALKSFKFSETKSLELRGEFFNLFNRPTFGAPSTNIDSSSGAQVTSTLNTSREVELSLKGYF